jgi:hypothetical protein
MNQRAEIVLELLLNNNTYRMNIPVGALYNDAIAAAQAFGKQVEEMMQNDIALRQKQAADQASSTQSTGDAQ